MITQGIVTDMGGKTAVYLVVHGKFFFAGFSQDADGFFFCIIAFKMTFNPEALVSMQNIRAILAGKITAGETEVIDGVQQIGLAHAIAATDTHDPLGKPELTGKIIFKLKDRYGIYGKTQVGKFTTCAGEYRKSKVKRQKSKKCRSYSRSFRI
jgi:hypothetical protein